MSNLEKYIEHINNLNDIKVTLTKISALKLAMNTESDKIVINIQNLQKTLEQISDMFYIISKKNIVVKKSA